MGRSEEEVDLAEDGGNVANRLTLIVGNFFAREILEGGLNVLEGNVVDAELPALLTRASGIVGRGPSSEVTEVTIAGEEAERAFVRRISTLVIKFRRPGALRARGNLSARAILTIRGGIPRERAVQGDIVIKLDARADFPDVSILLAVSSLKGLLIVEPMVNFLSRSL